MAMNVAMAAEPGLLWRVPEAPKTRMKTPRGNDARILLSSGRLHTKLFEICFGDQLDRSARSALAGLKQQAEGAEHVRARVRREAPEAAARGGPKSEARETERAARDVLMEELADLCGMAELCVV